MTSSLAVLEDLISTPKPLVRVQKSFTIKYRIEGSDPQKEMKQISEEINSRFIPHILHANINDLKSIFQKYMPIFGSKLKKLNSSMISVVEDKNDLLKIAQSEYEMYESLKKTLQLEIDPNYAEQLTQFFDNLRDYENVLFGIIINRLDNLKESLKKVNIDDLKNNTYGGFLAFVCIITLLNEKNYDKGKLQILLNLGIKYSEEMTSYIDTLDILSDPNAMTTINRSD